MILSDSSILFHRSQGNIVIEPFNESQLNPNSYNLRLGNKLRVYTSCGGALDSKQDHETFEFEINDEGFYVQPGSLYLATTLEYTESHRHAPMIEGRSSFGRLGLMVHVTAGFGDVGFCGEWTLEVSAVNRPVKIYPGQEICQISWFSVDGPVRQKYQGRYQGQRGPTPFRSNLPDTPQ